MTFVYCSWLTKDTVSSILVGKESICFVDDEELRHSP